MLQGQRVAAVIVAGGSSSRMGFDKMLAPLQNGTVIEMCVRAFVHHPMIDEIVVVAAPENIAPIRALVAALPKVCAVVPGGATRPASVQAGLARTTADWVAIHDGARPFVSDEVIELALLGAVETGCAAPAVPVKDTIKVARDGVVQTTPARQTLYAVQTPQVVDRRRYLRALAALGDQTVTDDCTVMERDGVVVRLTPGEYANRKLTTPEDLPCPAHPTAPPLDVPSSNTAPSEAISPDGTPSDVTPSTTAPSDITLSSATPSDVAPSKMTSLGNAPSRHGLPPLRVGHGYDVHRLVEGRRLVLGGCEVPFEKGLLGHSDADVLTHAVMDALLGGAALGDIGQHFPDTDAAYEGADSLLLLGQVARLLRQAGWAVANVDATILCQRPKLAPYLPAMRQKLAQALSLPPQAVSVKATTEEKLGFTGAGAGIAAHCVAMLYAAEKNEDPA